MKLQDLIETQAFYKNLSESLSEEIPFGSFSINFRNSIEEKNKILNETLTFSKKELFKKFDYKIFFNNSELELKITPKKTVSINNENDLYLDFINLSIQESKNKKSIYDFEINSIVFTRKIKDHSIKYNISSKGSSFIIEDKHESSFTLYEDENKELKHYIDSNYTGDMKLRTDMEFMFLTKVFNSLYLISLKQGNNDLIFDITHGGKKFTQDEEESMFLIYDVALDMKNDYSFFTDVSKVDLNKLFFHKDKKIKNNIGN